MMTAATSFASPHINWDIRNIQTKMSAYVFKRSQRHRRRRKSELHPTLFGRKRPRYKQQLDIHKGRRQGKPAVIFERFENQLEPKKSHRIHRYTLQGIRQEQSEPVDDFISRNVNFATTPKLKIESLISLFGDQEILMSKSLS